MIAAYMRPVGEATTYMLWDVDWSALKRLMCIVWDVEQKFDGLGVWGHLHLGTTVLLDGSLYCLYRPDAGDDVPMAMHSGDFQLFPGSILEILPGERS